MDYSNLALFSDLDGTLFNSKRQVSQKNREALAKFQERGGLFGIATGRSPQNAQSLLQDVPINTWSVVLNGAEAYDYKNGAVAFPWTLPQLRLAGFLTMIQETMPQVNILLCSESHLFFLSDWQTADPDFVRTHQPAVFAPMEQALAFPWMKVMFCAPHPVLEEVEEIARSYDLYSVLTPVYTLPNYLEFMPYGVNKGRCLKDLKSWELLRSRKIIAVGDGLNDVELLQEADFSATVENASDELKHSADIILPSNEDDAIAYLIQTVIPSLP